jgi:hypothetical protein
MSGMHELLAAAGYEAPAATWDLGPSEPVPMARWGKDHWTTFAYIETRWVDYRGMLEHDHMRCDRQRHPVFYSAKRRTIAFGSNVDGARYPTRLKTDPAGADGRWGSVDLPGHDDYDCLGDAIREGLVQAAMPRPHDYAFLDALDRPVRVAGGEIISPALVTGLTEMWLMTAASFSLTEQGQALARELRAHLAATRNSHQFMPAAISAALLGEGSG